MGLTHEQPIKIGTHDGTFHCDEILACCMLKFLKPSYEIAEIVRSRNPSILGQCDYVVDVGGEYNHESHRYDHHQRSFDHCMHSLNNDYPWTIKLSSAGLVYFHFGHDILKSMLKTRATHQEIETLFNKIYENFIQEIDAIDNGVEMSESSLKYNISTNLSSRVKRLNPSWNNPIETETECFFKALELVKKEFTDIVNHYCDVWLPAKNVVEDACHDRFKVHPNGDIIELVNGGCPWKEHLFEYEKEFEVEKPIKFVIYEGYNDWRVQCVPINAKSFINRVSLPPEWCGLRDKELSEKANIPDCVFVHMNGFIGGNKTRNGALEMAMKALYKQ